MLNYNYKVAAGRWFPPPIKLTATI